VTTQLIRALHHRFRAHLTSYGWRCLLSMALGMWIAEGKKKLAALTYLVSEGALSRFFNGRRWPKEEIHKLRQQMSEELIRSWYGGRGRPPLIYLILDGTVLPKRGKQLPKLGWHYDSRIDGLRWGQKLVLAVLRVGELALPWDWRAYVNRDRCKEADFQKSTEQAVEMLKEFRPPALGEVVVVTDSCFCVEPVIRAVVEQGYSLVGWVRNDRRLEDGRYAREVPSGTVACLRGLPLPVKIVQMYREGRHYTVISTDLDLNPAQIKRRMRKRWWCEEVIKRLKGLGLEDCQCRGEESLERWVEWVMLLYLLAARVRWAEREGQPWLRWREVGKELAEALFSADGLLEVSEGWMRRMLDHLQRREPWLGPLIRLFQVEGSGGRGLQIGEGAR